MIQRPIIVYGLLASAWVVIIGWQVDAHKREAQLQRAALIQRAKTQSDTLGLALKSQRPFGGVISKERLESALKELVHPGDLDAIALLNAAGDIVVAAGDPINLPPDRFASGSEYWGGHTVMLMNLVELGVPLMQDIERIAPAIVMSRDEIAASEANRPPQRRRGPSFGRPSGMSQENYEALLKKQGVRSFVIVMSTQPVLAAIQQDFWLRVVIGALASVTVIGFGLAWGNLVRSSDLQIRLVRASELNMHLKDMNLAAAGLAHETRNPLNIIRGFAQIISRNSEAPPEIRRKSLEIIDETDRVTAQLNEFINYSRPREVRVTPVDIQSLTSEVIQTLNYDIEEKKLSVQNCAESLTVAADELLLRQSLFNLLINAIQAVEPGGEIVVRATPQGGAEAVVEIIDNGPGVPAEHRQEIFKPYFTTQKTGTGLGLAVVQQIVLAHGWEIEFAPNAPNGSIFRLSRLKLSKKQ